MESRTKRQAILREMSSSASVTSRVIDSPSQRPSASRPALPMSLAMQGSIPEPRVSPERNGDMAERSEHMDLDVEEAEEVLERDPWHVLRWLEVRLEQQSGPAEVRALSQPLSPSSPSAGSGVANVSGIISVHTQNPSNAESRPNDPPADEVSPSTSGMITTAKGSARREVCQGSEFDSDFDDEFDVVSIESATLANEGSKDRDIPDDEELEEPERNMIEAVERAMDDEADRLPGVSTSYNWEETFDSFRGVPEAFSGPTPGPIKDYDSPYEAFTDIWSEEFIELIVQKTNRYAKQTIDSEKAAGTLKPVSRLREWFDTDADEIMVFLAVFMYMGLDHRTSVSEYWHCDDYLEMPKFKHLLSHQRYVLLNKFLHFVDNTDVSRCPRDSEGTSLSPKLALLQPVISHLSKKFSSLYNLNREISINESLTLFKGRLTWVQTIRSKAARFGIKSYELCESQTGYLYKFLIYTGKESNATPSAAPSEELAGKSITVVLDLLKDLEGLGHCVIMNNFYNCPALARYLKSLKFDCLGTLRANRRNVPEAISKIPKNVAKGKIISRHCGDVSIVAWKHSKVVNMISTYHNNETYVERKAGKVQVKPVVVRDYNKTMVGVDLKDQKLSMYLLERKRCVKWYVKIFKRLLNVSILNAFIMYTSSLKRRGRIPMTHREFRYSLAKSLAERHHRPQLNIREPVDTLMRLRRDVLHVPKNESGRNNRKRCVVCYKQGITKMVHSSCITCGVYLHFEDCWKEYHSLRELKGQDRGRKRRRNNDH